MAGVMWRGTVQSMTLNCSPVARSLLFPFMQSDGVKLAENQGLCTTLSYVAFTDCESVIGDAMRIQEYRVRCQPLVR